MSYEGTRLLVTVDRVEIGVVGGDGGPGSGQGLAPVDQRNSFRSTVHGLLDKSTAIVWVKPTGGLVNFEGSGGAGGQNVIFRADFDFAKLGIGGLGKEFNQIFRRAFASRLFDSGVVRELGINHVRGMLLYGPPGCGKTLIARQIGKVTLKGIGLSVYV